MRRANRFGTGARRSSQWLVLVALGVMTVTGCGDDDTTTVGSGAGTSMLEALEAGTWVLDPSASTPVSAGGRTVTLVIRGGVVRGDAPCNTYRGPVAVDGRSIEVGELATTVRACGDAADQAETAYLDALREVTAVDLDPDGRLVLTGGDGIRLVFSTQDTADLLVGEWHVRNLVMGDAVVSVVEGTDPVLTFVDDGSMSVAMGCNTARSDWTLEGDAISIGAVSQTKELCEEPAGVMEQEAAIVSALEAAKTLEISPDELTLLTGGGTIALVAATDVDAGAEP
jgi:heat shock protein HslJ